MVPELLTPAEVAGHLKVDVKTLYNWRLRDIGPPALKVGGALRYPAAGLTAWIEAGAPMSHAEPEPEPTGRPDRAPRRRSQRAGSGKPVDRPAA